MYSRTLRMGGIPYKMRRNNTKPNQKRKNQVVSAPVASNRSSKQNGSNRLRFKECERIATVAGSTSFGVVLDVPCNPGLPSSFPWLSGHAALYERYRVNKLTYRYKNLKGTSSDGNILMSFDYDTLDPQPGSAVNMTQQTHWIDGAPWRIFELPVKPSRGDLFIRPNNVASSDLKTYDFGRLFVAAEGCADTSDHGYLEVEYDIELFEKQSQGTGTPSNQVCSSFNLGTTTTISTDTVFPFDETITNPLGIGNASGVFTPPAGTYLVMAEGVQTDGTTAFTVELKLNGSSLSPPCLWTQPTNASEPSWSLTRPLSVSSSDEVTVVGTETGTGQALADANRITFLLL